MLFPTTTIGTVDCLAMATTMTLPQRNHPLLVSELIDESQAMPVLMPGRGRLSPNVSVDRFLYDVPFQDLILAQRVVVR